MRLNHPDYITLVIEAYNKKRLNNELPPLLIQSTPANIRRECANVYQERYEKKDEPALRAFFGPAEHGRKFLAVIQEFDINKFKPLDSYLKGACKKRINDRNLELLAWLIDFQHRPYAFGMEIVLSEEELYLIQNKTALEPEENDLQKKVDKPKNPLKNEPDEMEEGLILLKHASENNAGKNKYKRAMIIFLILIICTGGIYAVWQQKQDKKIVMGNTNTSCMYWANDHYEMVPCNEEPQGRLILPLNEDKMKNFKRITREDTITDRSVGKIYYIKNNRTIEYYTAGGNHPVYVTRILKVLSPYMFDNYLSKKEASVKDSFAEQNKVHK